MGRGARRRLSPPAIVVISTSPKIFTWQESRRSPRMPAIFSRMFLALVLPAPDSCTQTWHVPQRPKNPQFTPRKNLRWGLMPSLRASDLRFFPAGTSTMRCSLTKTTLGMTGGINSLLSDRPHDARDGHQVVSGKDGEERGQSDRPAGRGRCRPVDEHPSTVGYRGAGD